MKREKILTEQEMALKEVINARVELQRVKKMFDFAISEYFEIANTELTIAQMRYEVAVKKLKMVTEEGNNPQMDLFFAVSY